MSRRADAIRRITGWLVRGGLLGAWAFVGWGSFLLLVTLAGVVSEGPGVALGRLVPSPGASLWAWLNSLSVLLAVGVWLVALGLWLLRAARRRLTGRGRDVQQEARFQEFVGYYREWLGGPERACRGCPYAADRQIAVRRTR